jgi:glycosyltransferase 2 family protein
MPSKKVKQGIKLFLKLSITAVCIWYVYYKVDFYKMSAFIGTVNYWWLVLAALFFVLSKLQSSFRLNIYFKHINIHIPQWNNIQLYWLGMFYNLFLPGSISGDAYKVIRLTKMYGVSYKKTAAAVLLDRFSGLLALALLSGFFWLSTVKDNSWHPWVIAGIVLAIPVFYFTVKLFFSYFIPAFWTTFAWGMAVQLFQLLTMFCVLKALHIQGNGDAYMLIFLISSVVAVLPFTIGGLGAREIVFIWGAQFFFFDNTVSVMASALFYLVTVVSSLFGILFIFFDPLKNIYPPVLSHESN